MVMKPIQELLTNAIPRGFAIEKGDKMHPHSTTESISAEYYEPPRNTRKALNQLFEMNGFKQVLGYNAPCAPYISINDLRQQIASIIIVRIILCYFYVTLFQKVKFSRFFYVVLHSVTKVCGFYDAFEVLGCYVYN